MTGAIERVLNEWGLPTFHTFCLITGICHVSSHTLAGEVDDRVWQTEVLTASVVGSTRAVD